MPEHWRVVTDVSADIGTPRAAWGAVVYGPGRQVLQASGRVAGFAVVDTALAEAYAAVMGLRFLRVGVGLGHRVEVVSDNVHAVRMMNGEGLVGAKHEAAFRSCQRAFRALAGPAGAPEAALRRGHRDVTRPAHLVAREGLRRLRAPVPSLAPG